MLDEAYEVHSRFMATSTQIWSELQDFKEYSGNTKTAVSHLQQGIFLTVSGITLQI